MTADDLQNLEKLARECWKAEVRYADADAECEKHKSAYHVACDEVTAADGIRVRAWAIYKTAFVATVQNAHHSDPARARTLGEVLAWFRPRVDRDRDPDDREIIPGEVRRG